MLRLIILLVIKCYKAIVKIGYFLKLSSKCKKKKKFFEFIQKTFLILLILKKTLLFVCT